MEGLLPTDATCELCNSQMEMADHIIFSCPVAVSLWQQVGVTPDEHAKVSSLHSLALCPGPYWSSMAPFSSSCAAGTFGSTEIA